MQVCFLGLQAFSSLCQSVDFVNILSVRTRTPRSSMTTTPSVGRNMSKRRAAAARNAQRIHGNSTVKACDVQKTNAAKGTAIRNTTEAQGKSRRRARIGLTSFAYIISQPASVFKARRMPAHFSSYCNVTEVDKFVFLW